MFHIYDYDNKPTEVDISIDSINFIDVSVLSGDEVIEAHLKDGSVVCVDSSTDRVMDFYDGNYTVTDVKSWVEAGKDIFSKIKNKELPSYKAVSYERTPKLLCSDYIK